MPENMSVYGENLYKKNGSVKLAGWGDKTLKTGFYNP